MFDAPKALPRHPPSLSLVSIALLSACAGGSTVGDPEPPLRGHMASHFEHAGEIRSAVIRGDLAAVDEPAVWMATHEMPVMPPHTVAFVEDMRHLAQQAADADDLAGAATAVSRMARTCGSCHAALDGGPAFGPAEQPVSPAMVRHAWGMDRMWEGLVEPSESRWRTGAEALVGSKLELPADASAGARALGQAAAELGLKARNAADWGTRTELYGELLTTCSECHEVVGVLPEMDAAR